MYLTAVPGEEVSGGGGDREVIHVVDLEAADLVGYPINTDDRPTFEYYWIERMLRRKKAPRVFLEAMDLSRHTTDVKVKLP